MRLINVESWIIKDFIGDDTPPYAILSHTWGPEEVTLQDMQTQYGAEDKARWPSKASSRTRASRKKGYRKIRYTCEQAAKDGLRWAWVDTCCIDKSSSAELSEAINSMYRWYHQAQVCYAYLADVTLDPNNGGSAYLPDWWSSLPTAPSRLITLLDKAVAGSHWLTRGSTLQELLAPRDIEFYNARWTKIGTRNGKLRNALAFATGIDYECLGSGEHARLAKYSIATRMSWAARRTCTRTEDIAYCLMGIFDINMPMLYGEGKKAFIRLQEEILKETEDHSLFAWAVPEDSERAWCPTSIFAESPEDFARSGNIQRPVTTRRRVTKNTKLGLRIELGEAIPMPAHKQKPLYLYSEPHELQYFALDCWTVDFYTDNKDSTTKTRTLQINIPLLRATAGGLHDSSIPSFCRLAIPKIETGRIPRGIQGLKRVYIRKNLSAQDRNVFRHGCIYFLGMFADRTVPRKMLVSPDFATHVNQNGESGIVEILINPWAITGIRVKWSITEFRGYFTVAIGLGPNTIHCCAREIEPGLKDDAVIAVFDKYRRPTTICADYRNKQGRLAFDRVKTETAGTWRVELYHDYPPSTAYTSGSRLHLLVKFIAVKPPDPYQQQPSSPLKQRSYFGGLFGGR